MAITEKKFRFDLWTGVVTWDERPISPGFPTCLSNQICPHFIELVFPLSIILSQEVICLFPVLAYTLFWLKRSKNTNVSLVLPESNFSSGCDACVSAVDLQKHVLKWFIEIAGIFSNRCHVKVFWIWVAGCGRVRHEVQCCLQFISLWPVTK